MYIKVGCKGLYITRTWSFLLGDVFVMYNYCKGLLMVCIQDLPITQAANTIAKQMMNVSLVKGSWKGVLNNSLVESFFPVSLETKLLP